MTAKNTPKDKNKNSKQNEKERGVLEDLRKKNDNYGRNTGKGELA